MKQLHYILAAILILISVTSCEKDPHSYDPALAVELQWEDDADATTDIDNIALSIYDSNGNITYDNRYVSAAEVASDIVHIPTADYIVTAIVNTSNPFQVVKSERHDDTRITMSRTDSYDMTHAFYAITDVYVTKYGVTHAVLQLYRVLAELTIQINNMPDGVTLTASILNASTAIFPFREAIGRSGETRFGVASDDAQDPITLPGRASSDTTILTDCYRVMPTVNSDSYTRLSLTLTTTDGNTLNSQVTAPKMYPSGKYIIQIDYNEIQPVMSLSTTKINQWVDGWVINGDIYEPD